GHAQAAAGVAGVMKMVLALWHGVLPRSLYAEHPSPFVDWSGGGVRLLAEQREWPEVDRPRRAGVSAFGISGTNAHLILEQAPPDDRLSTAPDTVAHRHGAARCMPWLLSGKTQAALRAQATRLAAFLDDHPDYAPEDVGQQLATTRTAFAHRAAIVGSGRRDFRAGLVALAEDGEAPGLVRGSAAGVGGLGFVFAGQGSQWCGMGSGLGGFAGVVDEVCAVVDPLVGFSVREVMFGSAGGVDVLDRTGFAQPALFVLEVALFRLLGQWGVRPGLVVGHSVGEVAAAHAAGVLSLSDAAVLVAARARLMQALPSGGAMVAVRAEEAEVWPFLADRADRVGIAAVNGPASVVISGDEDAVLRVATQLREHGYRSSRLRVSHAFHSPRMAPMLEEFGQVVAGLSFTAPKIPMISTVSGTLASAEQLCTPDHWVRQVHRPVRFHDAIGAAVTEQDVTCFLELGPDAALSAMITDCVSESGRADKIAVVPTLRGRHHDEPQALATALAQLHVHGNGPDWHAVHAEHHPNRMDLPTYAFQHQRYWLTSHSPTGHDADRSGARFWEALDRHDTAALTTMTGIDVDRPFRDAIPKLSTWQREQLDLEVVDSWRYQVVWNAIPRPRRTDLAGTWLLVASEGAAADDVVSACRNELRTRGANVIMIPVTGDDRAALIQRLRDTAGGMGDGGSHVSGVLSLLALDERTASVSEQTPVGFARTLTLVQALIAVGVEAPLWCVTRGAVSVDGSAQPNDPLQALLWGFGRVAALEQPQTWGGLVDLPADVGERTLGHLVSAIAAPGGETEFAIRPTGVLVPRLVRAPLGDVQRQWHPEGTVLVTGGTGGVGAEIARWLAREGATRIVLTSRRGPAAPGAGDLTNELRDLGADVRVHACDIADRAALARLLAEACDDPPLTAVVHAAGVLDDGVIDTLTAQRCAAVFRPKVHGALNLDDLTRDRDLSAFVLFSSAAGTLGNLGQAAYAAANAFLDSLARHRGANGLVATSVAWGAWAGEGMAGTAAAEGRISQLGINPMSPRLATLALRRELDHGGTGGLLSDIDWGRFTRAGGTRPVSLSSDLPEVREAIADVAVAADKTTPAPHLLVQKLATLAVPDQHDLLLELVRTQAAAVLGLGSAETVSPTTAFTELGLDSMASVRLRNRLGESTGLRIPISLFLAQASADSLAGYLRSGIGGRVPAGTQGAPSGHDDKESTVDQSGVQASIDDMDAEDLVNMALKATELSRPPPTVGNHHDNT
ncbi:MAG: SDR family NAD(P)-dependent oxidoreductase, partial [Actinophytocola sp.]|uniref:SDR family NAD(P)-dependent oxidoreductase n=1 Tax=Actinophytocola sp. TaxID=1872138 RepID=UPI003C72DBB7